MLALVVEPDLPVAVGDHRRVMGDHQHGDALPDLGQDLADGVAGGRVQAGGHLVERQQSRP